MGTRILIATALGVILMSLVLVLAPPLGEQMFYLVYYGRSSPPVAFPEEAARYIRFTNGVLGAVMIGWMVLALRLVAIRSAGNEPALFAAIALSASAWFVIDTALSVFHGVIGNVLLNGVVAAGLLLPALLKVRSAKKS